MKTYKKKTIKTVDKILCDVCGNNTTDDYDTHENATIEAVWGYHSSQDGTSYEIHLCETCFTDIINYLKRHGVFNAKAFEGKKYI